jgi:peptide/nickel transport system permease protein
VFSVLIGIDSEATLHPGRGVGKMNLPVNPWLAFLGRRLVGLILVLAGLLVVTFSMVRLIPGDPALAVVGEAATEDRIQEVRAALGVDKPFLQQFTTYTSSLARGDMGKSFQLTKQPVSELIASRLGASLQLASSALALVLFLSLPLGILMGALTRDGRNKRLDIAFTAATSLFGALPEFLSATFLAFVFAVWLRLLPVAGDQGWQSLVLPIIAVSLRPILVLARIVRVETLNVLATDYIRTARSKRLSNRLIYARHVLPNVATAALTIGGLLFSGIVGGAVIVENIFNRPGLGTTLVTAVTARDYPVVQGIVLVVGFTVVVANAIVDISLTVVNPRSLSRTA